jgi:hypothetical protein
VVGSFARNKLKRLERQAEGSKWDLRCPECGWEITCYGDVALQLIVLDWNRASRAADPALLVLLDHEHPAGDLIEKKSGLPLADVSGISFGAGEAGYEDL